MKKSILDIRYLLAAIVLLAGCTSAVKVTSDWNEDGKVNLADKSVLVVARFNERSIRVATERQISQQLVKEGIDAKPSYKELPAVRHGNLNEDEVAELRDVITSAGYQAIVVTSLKHISDEEHTVQTGGFFYGGSVYPGYYSGFDSYYGSFADIYVPVERQTIETKTYSLETVAYKLAESEDQLFAVVTSNVTDPKSIQEITEKYASKVVGKLIK